MTKLNDLQTILLSAASQRDGGSLYPVHADVAGVRLNLRMRPNLARRQSIVPGTVSPATSPLDKVKLAQRPAFSKARKLNNSLRPAFNANKIPVFMKWEFR